VTDLAKPRRNGRLKCAALVEAACELARRSGKETSRVYTQLAETDDQRKQRELCEFIERRGGTVYEREVMQFPDSSSRNAVSFSSAPQQTAFRH